MDKKTRAKVLLLELESLAQPNESTINQFNLLYEVLRDAKALAEEVANDSKEVA